jgi:hypothetical protein
MGAWSHAIFGSDTAADIRGEYRDLIGDGVSSEEASRTVLEKWNGSLHEQDEAPEVWIALAAAQLECGRLQPYVLERALEMIDSGEEVRRWERLDASASDVKRRAQALATLREKLTGPQRKPARIRPRYVSRLDWQVGHAIAYRLLSGDWVIFRVLRMEGGGRNADVAIVDMCDWRGQDFPAGDEITALRRWSTPGLASELDRIGRQPPAKMDPQMLKLFGMTHLAHETDDERKARFRKAAIARDGKFTLYEEKRGDFPADRVQVIAAGLRVETSDEVGAAYFGGWAQLDRHLRTWFELD